MCARHDDDDDDNNGGGSGGGDAGAAGGGVRTSFRRAAWRRCCCCAALYLWRRWQRRLWLQPFLNCSTVAIKYSRYNFSNVHSIATPARAYHAFCPPAEYKLRNALIPTHVHTHTHRRIKCAIYVFNWARANTSIVCEPHPQNYIYIVGVDACENVFFAHYYTWLWFPTHPLRNV